MKPGHCMFTGMLVSLAACSAPGGVPHPAPVPRHAPTVQVLVVDRPERADSLAAREASRESGETLPPSDRPVGVPARPQVGRISGSLPEVPELQPQPDPAEQAGSAWRVAYGLGEDDWPERRILTNYYRGVGVGFNPVGLGVGIALAHSFHRRGGHWLFHGPALALRGLARLFR